MRVVQLLINEDVVNTERRLGEATSENIIEILRENLKVLAAYRKLLVNLRGPHQLIVGDTRPDALERAARLGATRTVDVTRDSLPEVVRELTGGRGAVAPGDAP